MKTMQEIYLPALKKLTIQSVDKLNYSNILFHSSCMRGLTPQSQAEHHQIISLMNERVEDFKKKLKAAEQFNELAFKIINQNQRIDYCRQEGKYIVGGRSAQQKKSKSSKPFGLRSLCMRLAKALDWSKEAVFPSLLYNKAQQARRKDKMSYDTPSYVYQQSTIAQ